MSGAVFGALAFFRRLHRLRLGPVFNSSGHAGPRRLAVLAALALATLTLIILVIASGRSVPIMSQDARITPIDPLPGGLHSTPEQDALALAATDEQAAQAIKSGVSYTPAMAPSQPALPLPAPAAAEPDQPVAGARREPKFVGRVASRPRVAATPAVATAFPPAVPPVLSDAPPEKPVHATPVAATPAESQTELQAYTNQINALFSQFGGQAPRTDIVLPTGESEAAEAASAPVASGNARARAAAPAQPGPTRAVDQSEILIPAGRGVYAHPVLALSSDETSPAVFQADSGPIAGDRMMGTFSRQSNRLIIHISSIIHRGEEISCDGVVIAPDTMEASVASGVDEHYLARFVLPAAAAFVAGLGQAIEQTSNSTAVLSPFGGATTTNHLNFHQQLGVAAGAAAAQAGAIINQEAPKGPTISLDANVSVGIMFLSNVTARRS